MAVYSVVQIVHKKSSFLIRESSVGKEISVVSLFLFLVDFSAEVG